MNKFITPGSIAGLLAFAAIAAGSLGKPALAAFLSSPDAAQDVLNAFGAFTAFYAGIARGISTLEAPKAA